VILVFGLNIIALILCCGVIQLILFLSKKARNYMVVLKKNYEKQENFKNFTERSNYNDDQHSSVEEANL
jgi:hypothetical protein